MREHMPSEDPRIKRHKTLTLVPHPIPCGPIFEFQKNGFLKLHFIVRLAAIRSCRGGGHRAVIEQLFVCLFV